MISILREAAASPGSTASLIAISKELATGASWLENAPTRSLPVSQLTGPAGDWGKRVDAIEAPFAPVYDQEEYANPGLQMLNLAELAMIARAVGIDPPWLGKPSERTLAGKKLLEVGCGTGRIALFGACLGATVTAADQTSGYVKVAAQKMNRLPPNLPDPNLIVAPAEAVLASDQDIVTAMFGVLNHCEDWPAVIKRLAGSLNDQGRFILSMYGSPEASVYAELAAGLPYSPAILTRRAPGGLLLGESADEVLPAKFPYPAEVLEQLEASGLDVQSIEPFLSVTALYPREPNPANVAAFLQVVEKRYGSEIASYLRGFKDSPRQLLVASLAADYQIPAERINEAAYFGVVATKGGKDNG